MLYYCDRLMIRLLALGSSLTCQVSLKPACNLIKMILRSFAVLDDTSMHLGWTRDKLSAARHTDSASNVPSMYNAFSLVPSLSCCGHIVTKFRHTNEVPEQHCIVRDLSHTRRS